MNSTVISVLFAMQAVTTMPDRYVMTCIADQQVGFNWRDGRYIQENFGSSEYVITVGDNNFCQRNASGYQMEYVDYRVRQVCVNVAWQGVHASPALSSFCSEAYSGSDNIEITVTCVNVTGISFSADPNGWFHVSSMHSNTSANPERDHKDSMLIGTGRCRVTR